MRPTIPAEETVPTPRPVAETPERPFGTQQSSTVEVPKRPLTHRTDVEQFHRENPGLRGKVVVHHAIEKRAAKIYPSVITKEMVHTGENLRGIPKEINQKLHLSQIQMEWNAFYRENPQATEAQIRAKVAEVDAKYGAKFLPRKR